MYRCWDIIFHFLLFLFDSLQIFIQITRSQKETFSFKFDLWNCLNENFFCVWTPSGKISFNSNITSLNSCWESNRMCVVMHKDVKILWRRVNRFSFTELSKKTYSNVWDRDKNSHVSKPKHHVESGNLLSRFWSTSASLLLMTSRTLSINMINDDVKFLTF